MTTVLKWLRWAAAAATVIALALLAWQCIDIYLDGNAPDNLDENGVHLTSVYSREIVAGRLRMLGLPLTICLAVLIVSGVMHLICADGMPQRTALTPENRLRLMKARLDELPPRAQAEERRRRRMMTAAGVVIALCALGALTYLLNGAHFTSWELEAVMGDMLLNILPWVIAAFAGAIIISAACGQSVKRELFLLKGEPLTRKSPEFKPTRGQKNVFILRAALYALAVVFIVLGVMNGGLYDVLVKAINICTECIGLG